MGSGGNVKAIPDNAPMISQVFSEPSYGFSDIAFFTVFFLAFKKINDVAQTVHFLINFPSFFMFLPSIMYGQHSPSHTLSVLLVVSLVSDWLEGQSL